MWLNNFSVAFPFLFCYNSIMNKIETTFQNHGINTTPQLKALVEQIIKESVQWVDNNPVSYPYQTFGEGLYRYWHDPTS